MVQILEGKPSFFESLAAGAAQQLPAEVNQYFSNLKNQKQQQQANQAAQRLSGMDLSGLDQDTQRALLLQGMKQSGEANLQGLRQSGEMDLQQLKQKQMSQQGQAEQFQDEQSYGKIKEAFGEKFANIWKAAPVGGKTELLKQGLDAKLRGQNVDQILEGVEAPVSEEKQQLAPVPQMKGNKIPKDFEWPDFTKRPAGYSPKDWVSERKTWRKENSDLFLENKTKLQNNKKDVLAVKKLEKLNDKMPDDLGRLIINPSTGEPYGLAQLSGKVPTPVQEWVKETARFQNRAKDAFGSRVTNFDLQSYMKQFPGLLNTQEGRSRILKMMTINNKLDESYEEALQQIYQKYGLSGIPMEEADKLAQSLIQDETQQLTDEYLGIDDQNQQQEESQLSGRTVEVVDDQGNVYDVDEREIDKLPPGFRLV